MKNIKVGPLLFPMPTYMINTYNEDNSVDSMMMAWGGICDSDMVALNLAGSHKTVANIKARKAFCLAVPSVDQLVESDYMGIVSANKESEKFKKTGLTAVKSEHVDAPVITEYPVTLECELFALEDEPYGLRILGKVVNILAKDDVLNADGKIDIEKVRPFIYDASNNGYYELGKKVGIAWKSGTEIK